MLYTLDPMYLDVLKEIGNIGTGNAATALSTMMNRKVDMIVPTVKILAYSELTALLGGPEKLILGILIDIEGDLQGMILILLEKEFTHQVVNALLGTEIDNFESMTEMDMSVVQEVGNILSASYLNSIAMMTGLMLEVSVPAVSVDMAGAILSVPAIKYGEIGDEVLLIEGGFIGGEKSIGDEKIEVGTKLLMILEEQSLKLLMEKLGVSL